MIDGLADGVGGATGGGLIYVIISIFDKFMSKKKNGNGNGYVTKSDLNGCKELNAQKFQTVEDQIKLFHEELDEQRASNDKKFDKVIDRIADSQEFIRTRMEDLHTRTLEVVKNNQDNNTREFTSIRERLTVIETKIGT